MSRFTFILLVFVAMSARSFAADSIIVHKDVRLDMFTARQAAVNKATAKMTSNGMYRGYRLQLLNTRARDEAFKLKYKLLQSFPDQLTYILYQSPYFKVRIGNFL